MSAFGPFNAADLFNVEGWVGVVTGGGTGIGIMAAKALAANGCKVYITGRRLNVLEDTIKQVCNPELLGNNGGQIIALQMDVTDKESIRRGAAEIEAKEGFVNVLVNNAGVCINRVDLSTREQSDEALRDALFNDDPELWHQTFQTNVTANYFVASAFIHLLMRAKTGPSGHAGNIINISSLSGLTRRSQNGQFSYNASKAANAHLTRLMCHEFSHPNVMVRVNTISPGWFPSAMGGGDAESHLTGKGVRERMMVPADRYGWETEMAKAVLGMATNEYVWGAELLIDGGLLMAAP